MQRAILFMGFSALILFVGACDFGEARRNPKSPLVSEKCANAFAAAAGVDEYHDTHQDLFPAYSACKGIEEWKAANALYPKAMDGADPVRYAMTVCAYNQGELGTTPICKAVNTPSPTDAGVLKASALTGMLGVPLPKGAELTEQTPGNAAEGRDPMESYSVAASASEIASFFNYEMSKAGWAKDGTSTEEALFFHKKNLMIGILITPTGDKFTLIGS